MLVAFATGGQELHETGERILRKKFIEESSKRAARPRRSHGRLTRAFHPRDDMAFEGFKQGAEHQRQLEMWANMLIAVQLARNIDPH